MFIVKYSYNKTPGVWIEEFTTERILVSWLIIFSEYIEILEVSCDAHPKTK